jgi:hypothetical protein
MDPYHSKLVVRNSRGVPHVVAIEPWAEDFTRKSLYIHIFPTIWRGSSDVKGHRGARIHGLQKAGVAVFVFLCGIPALEMNGFGFGIPFSPLSAFACATVGGALGGVMICPRPMSAGLIGGLLVGTLGSPRSTTTRNTERGFRMWNW